MIDELTMADIPEAAALSAGFNWPHRELDWARCLDLGHGFAWRQDGRLAGTAMWFPLGEYHASIGLVQVVPSLQGRGAGRKLMEAVIADAQPRSLMLHATAEGAGLYAKLGFETAGAVEQWQGVCTVAPAKDGTARLATADDLPAVYALDAAAYGIARRNILDWWMPDATIAITGPAGAPSGYAMRREFGRGMLIGPMAATSEAVAMSLTSFLTVPGFLRIDVPTGGAALQEWLASCGLAHVGGGQLMRRGTWPAPQGPACRWALVTQAIG